MQINTKKDKVGVYMGLGSCFWTNNHYFLDGAISEQPQKYDFVQNRNILEILILNISTKPNKSLNNKGYQQKTTNPSTIKLSQTNLEEK